jgi:hypothetical protein
MFARHALGFIPTSPRLDRLAIRDVRSTNVVAGAERMFTIWYPSVRFTSADVRDRNRALMELPSAPALTLPAGHASSCMRLESPQLADNRGWHSSKARPIRSARRLVGVDEHVAVEIADENARFSTVRTSPLA